MTLMLRPEVWQAMYAASPGGAFLPPHDPTLIWRWLFMLSGGLTFAGLWMAWLAGSKQIHADLRVFLRSRGWILAADGADRELAVAHFVFYNQPVGVRAAVAGSILCRAAGFAWFAAAGLILVFAAWAASHKADRPLGRLAGRRRRVGRRGEHDAVPRRPPRPHPGGKGF